MLQLCSIGHHRDRQAPIVAAAHGGGYVNFCLCVGGRVGACACLHFCMPICTCAHMCGYLCANLGKGLGFTLLSAATHYHYTTRARLNADQALPAACCLLARLLQIAGSCLVPLSSQMLCLLHLHFQNSGPRGSHG